WASRELVKPKVAKTLLTSWLNLVPRSRMSSSARSRRRRFTVKATTARSRMCGGMMCAKMRFPSRVARPPTWPRSSAVVLAMPRTRSSNTMVLVRCRLKALMP
ncbi:hypothetical protein AeRB84_014203, partial [Aphanomyces euteiches]